MGEALATSAVHVEDVDGAVTEIEHWTAVTDGSLPDFFAGVVVVGVVPVLVPVFVVDGGQVSGPGESRIMKSGWPLWP